jgi:hypothetical protein
MFPSAEMDVPAKGDFTTRAARVKAKDEGGRMKDEGIALKPYLHPSSLILSYHLFDLQPAWSQVQTDVGSESFASSQ